MGIPDHRGSYRTRRTPRRNQSIRPLPPNTVGEIVESTGLTLHEAKIIVYSIPRRGSELWHQRELLRRSIGCCCVSP